MSLLPRLLRADCSETAAGLSDHLEGTLSRWRKIRLLRHLAECEGCQAVLGSLTVAVERLRALGRQSPPPSPALAEAVLERIRREAAREGDP